jgi:hypothetical protein
MANTRKHFDVSSLFVIFLTLILFISALFIKGFTHDLLLEAGVFLVSVKLIIMSYKQDAHVNRLLQRLEDLNDALQRLERK